MPWGEIGLHSVALVAFPGALTLLALGSLAEVAAAVALVPGGRRVGTIAGALTGWRSTLPPASAAAGLLAMLAVTQAAFPLNPVPAGERNLLVAAIALVSAGWAAWVWTRDEQALDPRLLLPVQCAWLLAVFAPAIVPETLRPESLGAILVQKLLPLKVACGVLYLLCLPVLLQLVPAGRAYPFLRVLLWLPYCALFTSLFFPPFADDAGGLLRFLGVCAAAALAALLLAAYLLRHRAALAVFNAWLVVPFAWLTLGLAMLTAAMR